MDLGYGFVFGVNKISKKKVCCWLHTSNITWNAFVWYIADYADIVDYGEDWINVRIVSEKQREFFYKKTVEYCEEICTHNYEINCRNNLWKDHKRGAKRNYDLLRIMCENYL